MTRFTILISIAVGLIFGFYHFAIPYIWKVPNYTPLVLNDKAPSFTVDETNAYAPEVREIIDGHIWPSDFFAWEYKNAASPFKSDLLPALIMGGLSKLAGGVNQGFILADFLLPVLSFLSLGYLIFLLSKKTYLALAGALLVMGFSKYFSYFPYLPSMVKLIINNLSQGSYSEFIRSFHPQTTMPFFIIWVILLWQTLIQKKDKAYPTWRLGLCSGILFYTYIYYWTLAVTWMGLIIILSLYQKNFDLLKKLCLSLGIGLIIAAPVLIELLKFNLNPVNRAFSLSYEFLPPLDFKMVALVAGLIIISYLLIKKRRQKFFWLSFFSANLTLFFLVHLLNIKVDDPVGHWLIRAVFPMGIILVFIIAVEKVRKRGKILGIGLCCLLLLYQARIHWVYFKKNAATFQIESDRLQVFDWLNHHTTKDSVIVTTNLTDNIYLTVYTHNNVFIPFSYLTLAPVSERETRFLTAYKLAGISPERILSMFSQTKENSQLITRKRFSFDNCGGHYLYYRQYTGSDFYNCSIPENKLNSLLEQYQQLKPDLNQYRADYWLGTDKIDFGRLVWENQTYKIYALR